jgi:hypothetical protein
MSQQAARFWYDVLVKVLSETIGNCSELSLYYAVGLFGDAISGGGPASSF